MQLSNALPYAIVFVLTLFVLPFAAASEASFTLNIAYTANFNSNTTNTTLLGDISPLIFIGSNTQPFGNGTAVIPLTSNKLPIVDQNGSEDVPGLYVQRGQDVFGKFILFTTYGNNLNTTRESIKFDIELANARIAVLLDDPITPYEQATNGSCGITEGSPETDNPADDEYTYAQNDATAEFCSVTSDGVDRVRVYYILDDIFPPAVNNLLITPSLPLTKKESVPLTLAIDFSSDEAPTYTTLVLKDSTGTIVDTRGPTTGILGPIEIMYEIPTNLTIGTYTLFMTIKDSKSNEQTQELGEITVEKKKYTKKKSKTIEDIPLVEEIQRRPAVNVDDEEDELIVLDAPSKKATPFGNWTLMALSLLILNFIIFLLVIILALRRR